MSADEKIVVQQHHSQSIMPGDPHREVPSRRSRDAILDEIIRIQREYVRDGDPQRMWDLLIEAVLSVSGSAYGFIAEVVWGQTALPQLETRAIRWLANVDGPVAPHPELGLLMSQVIANEEPVVVHPTASPGSLPRFSPASGFLGLPLTSAERLVGVVGLTGPEGDYDEGLIGFLEPLLAACASIVESIQAARARDAAVARLERTAGFLNAVIESTAHGILVIKAVDGTIESANRAAHLKLDPPGGAFVGSRIVELLDGGEAALVRRVLRVVGRRGLPPSLRAFEIMMPGRDGTRFPAEALLSEFSISGERRLVVMFRDISDRVEAERSSSRAMEIMQAAPDLIAWSDMDGALRFVNSGGRRLLGLDSVPEGLPLRQLCSAWSAERLVDEAIPTAMLEGSWSGELFMTDSSGLEIPVWMVVIAGDSNGSDYLAYLARDLRERQQVERLKEAFISNVSHELRTPLTSILGYAELMAEGAFGDISAEMKEALDVVERNGDRLLHLIGQILRVAGLGEDDGEFTGVVDLAAVVESVVSSLEGIGAEHRTVVDASPLLFVKGDGNELETMLSNLVANAYKFTPPGGTVSVTLHRTGQWASLEVADTGIGIPTDDLDRIFQRFHRGQEARRREIQGTGLGLAIVESVVRRHGGRITVGSELGHGTSFRVMLPTTTEERR